MANYATLEHLEGRLGTTLIDDLVSPPSGMDKATYTEFLLENSCGLIDGYLNKYYETPIVTDATNAFCRELALDLTEYEIWKRGVSDDVPTKYKTSHDDSMAILRDIQDGKLAPFGPRQMVNGNASIDLISDTRVMGEDELKVY